MSVVGYATLQVIPSVKGISSSVQKEITTPMARGGRAAGEAAGGEAKKGFVRSMAGLGALAAGLFATDKIVEFFKQANEEATESIKVNALTNQVLKSTGQAANVTAKHVGNLANSISAKTGVDDEAIQSNENLLLTFTNIRNETGKGNKVFDQATQAVSDMSAALGQSGKTGAIQLGKALNDPIKGVTALSRVGVSFTAQQKKQIKTLVDSGNTLAAQKIILKEVNREFGGAAAAAATPAEKMTVAWKNFQETVGLALMPMFNAIANVIAQRLLPGILSLGGWLKTKLTPSFVALGHLLTAVVFPAFVALGKFIVEKITPPFQALGGLIQQYVVPVLAQIEGRFRSFIGSFGGSGGAITAALGPVQKAFSAIGAVAKIALATLSTYFQRLGPVVFSFYSTLIKGLLPALGRVVSVIAANVVPIIRALADTFTRYVIPALVGVYQWLQANLIPILISVVNIFATRVIPIVAAIVRWFVGELIPAIAAIVLAIGRRLQPVFTALAQAFQTKVLPLVAELLAKFNEWRPTIQRVVTDIIKLIGFFLQLDALMLGKVLPVVIKLAAVLVVQVVRSIIQVIDVIVKVIAGIDSFVRALISLAKGAAQAAVAVIAFFASLPGKIASAVKGAATALVSSGRAFISGLSSGATSAWKAVAAWFSARGRAIVGYFRGALTWLTTRGRDVIAGFSSAAVSRFKAVTSWFLGIGKAVVGYLRGSLTWLTARGRDVIAGFINAVKAAWSRNVAFWTARGATIIGYFRGAVQWLAGRGRDVIAGFINAVKAAWSREVAFWTTRGATIIGYFRGAAQWLIGRGRDVISGLRGGIGQGWASLGQWFSGFAKRIQDYYRGAKNWLTGIGRKIMGGLKAGFSDGLNGLKDVFKGPIKWILNNILNPFLHALGKIPGLSKLGGINLKIPGLARGGGMAPRGLAWVGEEGPELIRVSGHARVYPHNQSVRMAKNQFKGQQIPGFLFGGIIKDLKGVLNTSKLLIGNAESKAATPILNAAAAAARALVGHVPGPGEFKDIAKGVINEMVSAMKQWIASGPGAKAPKGGGNLGASSATAAQAQAYARTLLTRFGWLGDQMSSLIALWNGESGWNPNAANPTSTAYGIAQFLDSTWGAYGPKTSDYKKQVLYGMEYIRDSYGSPSAAYSAWLGRSPHWYDSGGVLQPHGVGMNATAKPEAVLTGTQWDAIFRLANAPVHHTTVLKLDGRILARHVDTWQKRNAVRGIGGA